MLYMCVHHHILIIRLHCSLYIFQLPVYIQHTVSTSEVVKEIHYILIVSSTQKPPAGIMWLNARLCIIAVDDRNSEKLCVFVFFSIAILEDLYFNIGR